MRVLEKGGGFGDGGGGGERLEVPFRIQLFRQSMS